MYGSGINTDILLLPQTVDGYTAFKLAAVKNHAVTLKKMWGWAEETQINPEELKKNLLLAIDDYRYTMWHRSAGKGNLETYRHYGVGLRKWN